MTARTFNLTAIRRIAAAYPEEARYTPVEARERHFTDEQRLAWALRFERDPEARAEALLAIAGRP